MRVVVLVDVFCTNDVVVQASPLLFAFSVAKVTKTAMFSYKQFPTLLPQILPGAS